MKIIVVSILKPLYYWILDERMFIWSPQDESMYLNMVANCVKKFNLKPINGFNASMYAEGKPLNYSTAVEHRMPR